MMIQEDFHMKELYTKPMSQIDEFNTCDVVTTSIGFVDGGDEDL